MVLLVTLQSQKDSARKHLTLSSLNTVLVASEEEVDEAMQVYALPIWSCDLVLLLLIPVLPFSLWLHQGPN